MTTYKGIKGLGVQSVTTDAVASQMGAGAWASGGALNTDRFGLTGAGTQNTSALAFAGTSGPPGVTNTEEWTLGHAIKTVTTS